jgi:hypothetical protein
MKKQRCTFEFKNEAVVILIDRVTEQDSGASDPPNPSPLNRLRVRSENSALLLLEQRY